MLRTFRPRYLLSFYKVLKVEPTATQDEIKKSYFNLAKMCHPDVGTITHDEFLKIQEAYSVLKDPEQRRIYDREQMQGEDSSKSYYYRERETEYQYPYNVRDPRRISIGNVIYNGIQCTCIVIIFALAYEFCKPITEHELRRQNMILSRENYGESPSTTERRRKMYAQEMIDKKITSNMKEFKMSNGSAESTKAKKHRKQSLESIAGIKKDEVQEVSAQRRQDYM